MKNLIIGILIGIILTCSSFAVTLLSTTASGQIDEAYESALPGEYTDLNTESILDPLKRVGVEIDDRDIAEYYQLLIDQYDLVDDIEIGDDPDLLPDINKIVRMAASLPLQEAGKNIQDEDIARFYHDFLEDVCWEFD